uniref:Uncharacterized protein n=1 Tax=Anguilla anguilla TaxID=7936 RepID=A0A0E9UEH7_ANGAN
MAKCVGNRCNGGLMKLCLRKRLQIFC